MFLRKHWVGLSVLLIAIVAVGVYFLQTRTPKDPILIVKPVEYEKQQPQPTAKAPVGDTSQGGHFHEDGTWHGEPHAEVDRPVLPPLQAPETPKFVRPVSDTQYVTMADRVAASADVPQRPELEAMSDDELRELMETSYKKSGKLSPEVSKRMDEWANVHAELTRHAKTRAETDAILAEHAGRIKPLREAMESSAWEYQVHSVTGTRAFKILQARFLMEHEPQTDAFWTRFWSDF